MNPDTREKLMNVSVATLATALYKRGLRNQVVQGVGPVSRKGRNMVGPAFTLRYMPAREAATENRYIVLTQLRRTPGRAYAAHHARQGHLRRLLDISPERGRDIFHNVDIHWT